MVQTFVLEGVACRALGRAVDLAEVSRDLPSGAYTTLRTYPSQRLLRLEQHLLRLEHSNRLQGRTGQIDRHAARRLILQALGSCGPGEVRLRLTFAPPQLFASAEPFTPLPEALYRDGVRCVTVLLRRSNPHAKDTRFIATAHDTYGALAPGIHEALMLAEDGSLLEGLSSNFFALRQHVLHTEGTRVLEGVTRELVLEIARARVPVEETSVRLAELDTVTECFLTSASRGVLPVVEIDGTAIGDGRPGPVTMELAAGFAVLVDREAEPVLPA